VVGLFFLKRPFRPQRCIAGRGALLLGALGLWGWGGRARNGGTAPIGQGEKGQNETRVPGKRQRQRDKNTVSH
jgi:hypothetical protein